ncbi:MAG: MMPL family transporter, partial [Thermoanaerobaculia bacterium]
MRNKIIDAIAAACIKHPKLILLLAALASVLSITAVTRIQLDPDILNLVPQHNRAVQEFKRVISEMGTIDYHIVVIDIPEGRAVSDYTDYIDATGLAWSRSTLTEDVTYKVPNPVELIDTVLPRAMLFLGPEQIDEVATALSDENIRASVARNRAMLETPQALALKEVVQYDPFNLLPIFLEKLKGATGDTALDLSSGYYLSQNHRIALVLAKPKQSAQDIPFAREIIAQSAEVEKSVASEFAKGHPDLPLPNVSYTGGYMIAFDDSELIKSDMIANITVSVVGVLLIFLWGFRRLASIVYAAIPLGIALIVTYGVAALTYDKLASAAAGFAALLAGLGIDFIMMVYGRYVDERNSGAEMEPALRTAMATTFPAVFVAAVTTAATFYAFLATDF